MTKNKIASLAVTVYQLSDNELQLFARHEPEQAERVVRASKLLSGQYLDVAEFDKDTLVDKIIEATTDGNVAKSPEEFIVTLLRESSSVIDLAKVFKELDDQDSQDFFNKFQAALLTYMASSMGNSS